MATHDLIDTAEIARMVGVTREYATDRLVKRPGFPRPAISLSQKTRRWRRGDVQRWLDQQAQRCAA